MQAKHNIPNFIHFSDLDSTNNYVANLVRQGKIESGTVVSADFQHDGRGQRATKWQSLVGQNALFSIFIKWGKFHAADQFQISMLTALSLAETLEQFGLQKVKIKWPNDIYIDGHKIAGILIENDLNGQQLSSSILGIGLNVNQVNFNAELRATSMKLETGQSFDIQNIIQKITYQVFQKINELSQEENHYLKLKNNYLNKLLGFENHQRVFHVKSQKDTVIKILDISKSGQLLASNEQNQLEQFDIKDIVWTWE
jgi:BirA family transcriptional regulator, biotin operon repressor / biotin---[acetyl-CoA-carboxylase] ligase